MRLSKYSASGTGFLAFSLGIALALRAEVEWGAQITPSANQDSHSGGLTETLGSESMEGGLEADLLACVARNGDAMVAHRSHAKSLEREGLGLSM